jgi:hypothetical protein
MSFTTFAKTETKTNMNMAFILVVIIALFNTELIYKLNKFYIGKMVILAVIVLFTMSNAVLGLLLVFIYFAILEKYKYILEGMNTKPTTESDKNKLYVSSNNTLKGIDIQDIQDSVTPKDSNSFPLSKNMFSSGDDIEPFVI